MLCVRRGSGGKDHNAASFGEMLADLAVIWEILFSVPVGRQSSSLFRVPEVSESVITVLSLTRLAAVQLSWP